MNRKVYDKLDLDNMELDNNTVIFGYAYIYSNFEYIPGFHAPAYMDSYQVEEYLSHLQPGKVLPIIPIKECGYFVYKKSELLKSIVDYGKTVFNYLNPTNININQFINYKTHESYNFKTNIDNSLLNIIYKFFGEFGYNSNEYITEFEIVSDIVYKIIYIYLLNTLYESVTFFNIENNIYIDENIILNKLQFLQNINNILNLNLMEINIDIVENSDFDDLLFLLNNYKIATLDFINNYSKFFKIPENLTFYNSKEDTNSFVMISNNILDLAWFICKNKVLTDFKRGQKRKCVKCNRDIIVTNNQIRCSKCMKETNYRKITQQNKKNLILEILEISKNYVFKDTSIILKLLQLKELKNSGKIENIEEHKYKIKDLKKLKEQIQIEIALGNYTLK